MSDEKNSVKLCVQFCSTALFRVYMYIRGGGGGGGSDGGYI